MKTKIAFNDIPNGIERDEMKQVLGGNVASVYKEDSTVVSGRTDLLSGSSVGSWFTSVGDKGFMGSGSSFTTTDPNEIKLIMSALTGNTYNYNLASYDTQPRRMDCVFQCLGWISAMFGDRAHDSKFYENMYSFMNPVTSSEAAYNFLTNTERGIPFNQIFGFTSNFFNVTDFKSTSAVDLAKYINPKNDPFGNHQLMGIFRSAEGTLHAVNITSISGSTLNYFDFQNNTPGSIERVKMIAVFGISNRK